MLLSEGDEKDCGVCGSPAVHYFQEGVPVSVAREAYLCDFCARSDAGTWYRYRRTDFVMEIARLTAQQTNYLLRKMER